MKEKFNEYYHNVNHEIKQYFNILASEIPDFLIPYIETNTMQRLKDISYFCGMEYGNKELYQFKYYVSRLDHSISTALIIWHFTQNKIQTIAALFHDAGTPATSHVIDYLNDDYIIQESTEADLSDILKNDQNLLDLIKKDGYLLDDITDFKKYPLIDCKRPKLCSDRIDGLFLISLVWAKNIELEEIKEIYQNISLTSNEDNNLEYNFNDPIWADRFVELNDRFNELTNDVLDYNSMALLAKMIEYIIAKEIITYDDLFSLTDIKLFNIILHNAQNDSTLRKLYDDFTSLNEIEDDIPELKQRDIDPLILNKRYSKIK